MKNIIHPLSDQVLLIPKQILKSISHLAHVLQMLFKAQKTNNVQILKCQ